MERLTSKSQHIGLKVYRNHKLENKWGLEYHKAIQDIVFGKQTLPYTPTEPPPSLEENVESDLLYMCKQCKDIFRFQSSFEDHNTRRSWILGLWCQICFRTVCTHINETGPTCTKCSVCITKNNDKRAYLRTQGLFKGCKYGAVKVFYNQCQFIEHMKMHRLYMHATIKYVNMQDLMLIPLPINMSDDDWCSEFEILCEALMERAFLDRIHIIDWLKLYNIQDNWWKLVNGKSNNDMINKCIEQYQGRQLFDKLPTDTFENISCDSSNIVDRINKRSLDIEYINDNSIDNTVTNNFSTNITSERNIFENEDNPCTSNDIIFVDCGPTSQYFEPEIPENYIHQKQEISHLVHTVAMDDKIKNKIIKDNLCEKSMTQTNVITVQVDDNSNKNHIKQLVQDNIKEHKIDQLLIKKTIKNNFNKISDNPVRTNISFSAKQTTKSNLEHSEQNFQILRANSNSKVLTVKDSKNITSIISQLSPHLISNKKIDIIEQKPRNINVQTGNEILTKKDSSISIADNNVDSNPSIQKMCEEKQEITGKIILRNGKKYLIKRTNITTDLNSSNLTITENVMNDTAQETSQSILKSRLISNNEVENSSVNQTSAFQNNILILTPSPSPSELSNSSNCELQITKLAAMPQLQKIPPHLISISTSQVYKNAFTNEIISLIEEDNGDVYMNIKIGDCSTSKGFRDMSDVIVKYRQKMFDEFHQLNSLELKQRIDHLRLVSQEMKQVLSFIPENIFMEKERSINVLQSILQDCFNKCDKKIRSNKNDDVILNNWETIDEPVQKCSSCKKIIKSKTYIAGFSKLSKNDEKYCSCYKQICHLCFLYQGTMSRFLIHQNFHKMKVPYVCPDCNSKLYSATALEVHTWTTCFHTLRRIVLACKICEIDGFKDLESITRHFVIMHSQTKIGCEICLRVFELYSEYMEHCTEIHPSKVEYNPIRLVICKPNNIILRCEKYMSYLEKYPAVRNVVWFKCPFCSSLTTDNKYVMTWLNNHMRDSHVESLSKCLSKQAFMKIFGKIAKSTFCKNNEREIAKKMSHCTNSIVMPKIVNTRTISSELFEHSSQNTEWSPDANKIVNENPEVEENIDEKEEKELLPKIINVRSINDLTSSESEETITTFSTETRKGSSSSSSQIKIKEENLFTHEEVEVELDKKSNSNKETAKVKEFDKDNNESTINTLRDSESEKDSVDTIDVNLPSESNIKVLNSTPEKNTNNCVRVVNFTTICKPNIEELTTTKKMDDVQVKDEDASHVKSILKPPPLIKIPQCLIDSVIFNDTKNKPINDSKEFQSKESLVKKPDMSKTRFALGTNMQEEENIDYLCHLCNERINTCHKIVERHFREKHSDEYKIMVITPRLSRLSPDFIDNGYKQFINNRKRKSESTLFSIKRKRRWTPKKHIEMKDANSETAGLCIKQETAEDSEGNFICKKCSQRCTNISNLREHIAANHRLKGRYLICLECGENFVVVPSLQMHLKAFHGIEDPVNYMNKNPSYAPNDGDLGTEGKTTVANQCYVCMAVFENKAAVDKHLRVHGMAFLNHKRIEARNALEKKMNTEENKSNVIKKESTETAKRDKPAETILEKINAAI